MQSMAKEQEIGAYSAYAIAVKHGYVGTEEDWIEEQERNRKASEQAASDAESAKTAAEKAQKAAESSAGGAAGFAAAAQESREQAASSAAQAGEAGTAAGEAQKAAESAKSAAAVSASLAQESAAQAAGSAESADSAKTAAAQSEQRTAAAEANVAQAEERINTAVSGAVEAVTAQETKSVQAVAAQEQTSTVAVTAEGKRVLGTIPQDYTELSNGVSQLKDEIDALKGALGQQRYEEINYKSVDFEVGTYTPIGTLETVDVTDRTKADSWRTLVVSCKAGTTATFTAVGGLNPRAYAIVAPDGTVLYRAEASVQLIDYELYIAEDATLVINSDSVVDYYLTLRVPISQANILESIERRFETDVWFDADEWQVGYINTSGGVGSVVDFASQQATNYAHMILDCFTGMQIKITGMGGGKGRLWCFVNGDSIIHSVSGTYENGAELVAPIDGKIIVNAEIRADYPKSVKYTPNSLKPIAEAVANLTPSFNGALIFAEGASLKYETPEIPASPTLTGAEKLTHYYGLYDALASAYPDYVSKVDCDVECAAAGITRPDYMADYPIYMYKFIPAYTSNSNALDGVSDASRYKVYIVSGTHPEMMAIWDLYNTMRLICEQWKNDENLEALRWQCEFYVIPLSGSYCVANASRTNYNGVDLNRNAPSTDWVQTEIGTNTYSGESAASEYETKVFVHYMEQIQPQVFIDHHNTYAASDLGVLTYITSRKKSCVDVAASHISTMTRRWKKRFSNVLPDNNVIFGYVTTTNVTGARASYGNDCGAWSYTFESQSGIGYDNGVVTEGAHAYDAVASTIATDSFINFLLLALRNAAQRISAGLID